MLNISDRYLKAGVISLMVLLISFLADMSAKAQFIRFPAQIVLIFVLLAVVFAMTTVFVRRDARRARADMDALLEVAATENRKAERLCVMASAQIQRCLDKDNKVDTINSDCGRYEIVRDSKTLDNAMSSNTLLQENARLLELRQKIYASEKTAMESKIKYEKYLGSYCTIRDSVKNERMRKLLDLKVYPQKEKKRNLQSGVSGMDAKALHSRMQICTAWASI